MNYIRIAVLNKENKVTCFLDNLAPKATGFYDDELHTYLQGTAVTYKFTADPTTEAFTNLINGNKLAFVYGTTQYYLNIMHTEQTESSIQVEAYGLSFELLNEQVAEYKASQPMTLVKYIKLIDPEGTLTIGTNEVSDIERTLELSSNDTILKSLFSLADSFDAELEFETFLYDDYSLKKIVLNIYKEHSDAYQGVGSNKTGVVLRYGNEISSIRKTSDITDLYTAIQPTGNDDITISSLDKTEYDSDGLAEYITEKGDPHIKAVQARDRFPSNVMDQRNDKYIAKYESYDTDSVDELYTKALADLKENCTPKLEYTVDGYIDANVGDTFSIVDTAYKPELILEARVSEQVISFTDQSKATTTFTNFVEKQSMLSPELVKRMNELIDAHKTYTCSIHASNGVIFKNGSGSTTLTASVMDVGADMISKCLLKWYKNAKYISASNTVTISASDIDGPTVYRFEAYYPADTLRGFYEVTVANVNDGDQGIQGPPGEDGKATYFHVAYANSSDGKTGFSISDSTDKMYIGTYVSNVADDSTDPASYSWQLVKGSQGDKGDKGDTGIPGTNGVDGSTSYLHIAYATASDGSTGFSTSDSLNKTYIGQYVDSNAADSTSPSRYAWSKMKGEKGDTGDTGRGVYSITREYYRSTSVSTQTGGAWQEALPVWVDDTYLFERNKTVYVIHTGDTVSYETEYGDPLLNADWGDSNKKLYDIEQKVTQDGIVNLINESLANGKVVQTTSFTMNINGFTIQNGGLTVKDKSGNNVFFVDTNGDLTFKGNLSGANGTFKGKLFSYNSNGYPLMQVDTGTVWFYNGLTSSEANGECGKITMSTSGYSNGLSIIGGSTYGTGCINISCFTEDGALKRSAMFGGRFVYLFGEPIYYNWDAGGDEGGYIMHGYKSKEDSPPSRQWAHSYQSAWNGSALKFYVDGIEVATVSDARLKKEVEPVSDLFIEAVGSVDIKQYKINRKNDSGILEFVGAIAQDLDAQLSKRGLAHKDYKLFGTLTNGKDDLDEDGNEKEYFSLDYEQFLIARVAYDEKRIKALEKRLEALEVKING